MDSFLKDEDIVEVIELGDNDTPRDVDGDEQLENGNENNEPHDEDDQEGDEHGMDQLEEPLAFFPEHNDPVLTVTVSKSGSFVVSGGQDDVAHVWDTRTGEKMFSCKGHEDSVVAVGINCDDSLIATADMNGLIQVWKIPSGNQLFSYETGDEINWISWHPLASIGLLAGTSSGCAWMFNVEDSSKIKTLQTGSSGCTTGKVTKCGNKLMAGYEDGSLCLWDLKTCNIIHSIKGNLSHQSSVTCIDFRGEDDSLAASGSTDGTVKMTNLSSGKIVSTLLCGIIPDITQQEQDEEVENSVESVVFSSSSATVSVIATATVRGIIEVWEASNFTRRCYMVHEEGVSKILWDPSPLNSWILLSAGLDGCLCAWDARSGQLLSRRYCHEDQILDMKVFVVPESNEKLVVTASEDKSCKIFQLD